MKSIGIFGGAQCFTVLAALVRTKMAALLIGSAGVGLTAVFNAIATFVANLSSLGVASSAVRTLSEAVATGNAALVEEHVRRIRQWSLLTALAGGGVLCLASPGLSLYYRGDLSGTWTFSALGLVVVMTLLSGCELAIMKACRRVKQLAWTTILASVISVLFVVPFYYWMRMEGVIWAVVISSFFSSLQVLLISWRLQPLKRGLLPAGGWRRLYGRLCWRKFWLQSRPMILLGLAFVLSGVVASGLELCIQGFFVSVASLSVVGLYKAGYQLGVTYPGMVFSAIGNDFYPRLAAVNSDPGRRNELVNRQISVLLFMAVLPLTLLFECSVPYLLPLLFSSEFSSIETMVRWAVLALPFKAVALPIAFLPLALGKSLHFLVLESLNWVVLCVFVLLGYEVGGLDMVGVGILCCQIAELAIVWGFCRMRYGYRMRLHPAWRRGS